MLARVRNAFRRGADAWSGRLRLPVLSLTDSGFVRRDADGHVDWLEWADVDEIATCKVDCYVHDDVRSGFHRRSTGDWLEVSEDSPGFMDVVTEMRRRFPAIPDDWYPRVVETPFATNFAVLYRSPENSPSA